MSLSATHHFVEKPEYKFGLAYACYLGGLALAATWWPLHFKAIGLTGAQIGMIFALRVAISTLTQPIVTSFTDRIGRPILMLRITFLWGMFWPGMLLFADTATGVGLALCMSGLMTSSITPLLDGAIVRQVGAQRFGDIRLWGSVGYGLMVFLYGLFMMGQPDAQTGYGAVVGWTTFLACGALVMFTVSRTNEIAGLSSRPVLSKGFDWVTSPLLILLAINAFHWGSIQSFNVFISLHATSLGFGSLVVGVTAGVAIVGEVVGFILAKRLVTPKNAHLILPWVFFTGAIRWIITAYAPNPVILAAIQLVHFFGYGLWMSSLIHMLARFVPEERRTSAQGLMAALTLGVGGMTSNMLSGWLFDLRGGTLVFLFASLAELIAVIATLITWRLWSVPTRRV